MAILRTSVLSAISSTIISQVGQPFGSSKPLPGRISSSLSPKATSADRAATSRARSPCDVPQWRRRSGFQAGFPPLRLEKTHS